MRKWSLLHAMCAFLLLASVMKALKPVRATTSSYLPVAIKNSCLSLGVSVSNSTPFHHSCNARVVKWKVYSHLPTREETSVDVAFLLDESGSVNFDDAEYCPGGDCYSRAKELVKEVAIQLDAELGIFMKGGRIGWQEFSDFDNDPTNSAEHGQGMVTSVADFVTGIDSLSYSSGFSNLAWGLHLAAELLVDDPMSSSSSEKIMVVLTDGRTKNQDPEPRRVADIVRNINHIAIFGVGITPNSDIAQIQELSTSSNYAFNYGTSGKEIIEAMKMHLYSRAAMARNLLSTCFNKARLTLAFPDQLILRNISADSGRDWTASKGVLQILEWNIGDLVIGDIASISFVVEACGCSNPNGLLPTHDFALLTSNDGLDEILPKFSGHEFISGTGVEGFIISNNNSLAHNNMAILQANMYLEGRASYGHHPQEKHDFDSNENPDQWSQSRVSGPNLMSDVKRAIPALFNSSSTTGGIGLLQVIRNVAPQCLGQSNESDANNSKDCGVEVESNHEWLDSDAIRICETQSTKGRIENKEYCLCRAGGLKNCNASYKFYVLFKSISEALSGLELLLRPAGLSSLSSSLNVPENAIILSNVSGWVLSGGKIVNHNYLSSITYSKLSRNYELYAGDVEVVKLPPSSKGTSRVWVIALFVISGVTWVGVVHWARKETACLREDACLMSSTYRQLPGYPPAPDDNNGILYVTVPL